MKFCKLIKKFNSFENAERPEVALSVTHFKGKNYAAIRSMPSNDFKNSKIKFYELNDNFEEVNSEFVCNGEDPRIFHFGNELFFISWNWVEQRNGLEIFLFNLSKSKKIIVKTNKIKHVGKNWSFVNYNGNPYLTYSVDPLVLLKIDLDSGEIENFNISPNSVSISDYRGGSPLIQKQNKIIGLGHFTITNAYHKTFFFETDLKNENKKNILTNNESGVVDPYGFFEMNGRYYASITTSVREWINPRNRYSNEIWLLNEN